MSPENALVNVGELTKPATVLIEKISDALGGYFKPYQIRRVAAAEADAEKIHALAQLEISDLQRRALQRFVAEEAKRQDNIEAITSRALPEVTPDALSEKVEDDWIVNFFDKCRLISDDEMQALWSKVLAGEANAPGTYSKRTVNYLASLDKEDAKLFTTFCGYACFHGSVTPLIYDNDAEIYTRNGLQFPSLQHLDNIGLISFAPLAGFRRRKLPRRTVVFYYGTPIELTFQAESENDLALGQALLTKVGAELAPVCGSKPVEGFSDYLVEKWVSMNIACSSPYPRTP